MNVRQEQPKKFANTAQSRYVIVANIYPSKSQKTIKILDLESHLLGIALRTEILDLLAGKLDHVNVCSLSQRTRS
jgi:hypothetical protein